MNQWVGTLLVLVLLTDLTLLGASRLVTCIRYAAVQGILLGILTVVLAKHVTPHGIALAFVSAGATGGRPGSPTPPSGLP